MKSELGLTYKPDAWFREIRPEANCDDDGDVEDIHPHCPPPDLRVLVTSALVTDSSPVASVRRLPPARAAVPAEPRRWPCEAEAGKRQRCALGVPR